MEIHRGLTASSLPRPPSTAPASCASKPRHDARLLQPLQHALGDHVCDRLALGILDVHRGPGLGQQHTRLLVLLEGRHVHRRLPQLVLRVDGGARQRGEQRLQRADAVGARSAVQGGVARARAQRGVRAGLPSSRSGSGSGGG